MNPFSHNDWHHRESRDRVGPPPAEKGIEANTSEGDDFDNAVDAESSERDASGQQSGDKRADRFQAVVADGRVAKQDSLSNSGTSRRCQFWRSSHAVLEVIKTG